MSKGCERVENKSGFGDGVFLSYHRLFHFPLLHFGIDFSFNRVILVYSKVFRVSHNGKGCSFNYCTFSR